MVLFFLLISILRVRFVDIYCMHPPISTRKINYKHVYTRNKKKLILTNVIYANGYGDWWLCVIFIYRTNGRRRRFMYALYIVFIHKCPSFKLKMQQNWRTMNWKRCIFWNQMQMQYGIYMQKENQSKIHSFHCLHQRGLLLSFLRHYET